jgi:hypothetical protein
VGDKIDVTQASSLLRRAGNLPGKKIVKLLLTSFSWTEGDQRFLRSSFASTTVPGNPMK